MIVYRSTPFLRQFIETRPVVIVGVVVGGGDNGTRVDVVCDG